MLQGGELRFRRIKFPSSRSTSFSRPGPTASSSPVPRTARIFSHSRNKAGADKADLVLELPKMVIYGMTSHPKFADNGYLYITYIPQPDKDSPKGSRGSPASRSARRLRSTIDHEDTRLVLFEWASGGHNGGGLKFGPDGFLYLGTGDSSGIADSLEIGQDLSSVAGRMLRFDVDHPADGKNYGIPKDNPFVGTAGARPEIYAYGLRQPWRFSFDRKTGDFWVGEVGQDLWEMVYRIEKGGNYGWSVMEGDHPFRPDRKKGPTPILKAVIEHGHADFRSLTGGFVYHGDRLPELKVQYIYGDFDTGRVWAFRYAGGKVSEHREIARTTHRIVSWAEDTAGELYFVDFVSGGIYRLVHAPGKAANLDFPKKLSQTGLFASTRDNMPAAGVIPYSVNAQLWGDHALKERFLALPGTSQIGFDEITYPQPSPGAPPGWRFPDGTVLVKTFSMELERGKPETAKRLETRILHFQQFGGSQEIGDQYWRGYTYVWNDEQTDADLLDAGGKDIQLKIKVDGKLTEQKYRFPSRAECTLCHTNASKFALGVSTLQMNGNHAYGPVVANQIATLDHIGVFTKPLPAAPEKLPKLADYRDEKLSAEVRARSYLHSNCSHCHMKWGGGNAEFKLLATIPVADMGIVGVNPQHGTFDIKGAKIVAPGDPEHSVLAYRMAKTGLGRMPHIASHVVDEPAVAFIREWIKGMK